ncbi:MAG: DUF2946 family protein [Caldimonas sp.]
MDRYRRKLKKFVWVTLWAFAGLAVAPTISRTIHLGDGADQSAGASDHEQMAAMGPELEPHHHDSSSEGSAQHPAGHSHSLDHCGMCVVAAFAFALASSPPAVAASAPVHDPVVESATAAPRPRDDWSPASWRGPPIQV